jgi:hypothetical protein
MRSMSAGDDATYLSNEDRVDALYIGVCHSLITEEIEEAQDFPD